MNVSRRIDGFSFMDLAVAVVVLGILAAVALPVFSAVGMSITGRTCFTNQRAIEGAVQQYASVRGELPPAGPIVAGGWCVPEHMAVQPWCPADLGAVKTPYSVNREGLAGTGAPGNADGCPINALTSHGHH